MTLKLAPDLNLPDDFATQGVAIIGVRGSGKSNTEVRYAELLHDAGIPFTAIDPKGDWHGIRMTGTGPGLPIPVFGGLYGDFPLDETLGARIADLLVNENLSAVLDVSRLSKTVGLPRFLTAFCNQLMDRHQQEPHVRSVILEEAHRYIPQVVSAKTSALKEAAASILLEGRAFGLGCWACTQRPARLHNDVLEEVDTAIIHRIGVTATADLGRVRKWVEHEDLGPEIGASLTKLKNGEAWVLSPTALELVQRVRIDRRTTFDSGATPTVGAKKRSVATMADIDAPAIKEALHDAIEQADKLDPKKLQARIRDLERELSRVRAEKPEVERVVETVEVVRIADGLLDQLAELRREITMQTTERLRQLDTLRGLAESGRDYLLDTMLDHIDALIAGVPEIPVPAAVERVKSTAGTTPAAPARVRSEPGDIDYQPRAGARRMLDALASWSIGLTDSQLGTLAKVKKTGGTFGTYTSELRRNGLIERHGDLWIPSDAGLDLVGGARPPTDPAEARAHWRSKFTGGARRMYDLLVDAYPRGITADELADRAGITRTGGTFGTYVSRLRSNGCLREVDGEYFAHPDLFMEAIR